MQVSPIFLAAVACVTIVAACNGGDAWRGETPVTPQRYTHAIPAYGARVRFIAPELGPGWRVGMFNQTRQNPPCYLVVVFNPGSERTYAASVYAASIVRLQVSTLYDGSAAADPDPSAAAYEGELWMDAPLDSMKASGRACPAKVERAR